EGHDGMRSVAEQPDASGGLPTLTVQRRQAALWMRGELCAQVTDRLGRVGKMRGEEAMHRRVRSEPVESRIALACQEQRCGEAAIEVGQADEHVAPAR